MLAGAGSTGRRGRSSVGRAGLPKPKVAGSRPVVRSHMATHGPGPLPPSAATWHDGQDDDAPFSRISDPIDAPAVRWGVLAPGGIAHEWTAAVHARTASVWCSGLTFAERAQAFATEFGATGPTGATSPWSTTPRSTPSTSPAPLPTPRPRVAGAGRRQTGAGGEGVHPQRDRGGRRSSRLPGPGSARRRGDVDALPPTQRRRARMPRGRAARRGQAVAADHGQLLYPDGPGQRLADPALAGGALLDLAIYPVSFAHLAMGGSPRSGVTGRSPRPASMRARRSRSSGRRAAIGTLARRCSRKTPCSAAISGTAARLEIDGWFYQPNTVRLLDPDDREIDRYESPSREHGLAYEAAEFARLLAQGKTESDLLPLDETAAHHARARRGPHAARCPFPRRGLM